MRSWHPNAVSYHWFVAHSPHGPRQQFREVPFQIVIEFADGIPN